jgi:hypothetical protein
MALVDPAETSGDEDVLIIVKSDSMMNKGMELALFTFAKSSASRMPSRDSSKNKIRTRKDCKVQQRTRKGEWYLKGNGRVSCDCLLSLPRSAVGCQFRFTKSSSAYPVVVSRAGLPAMHMGIRSQKQSCGGAFPLELLLAMWRRAC